MSCSIMNARINMLLDNRDTVIAMMMEKGTHDDEPLSLKRFRSALQNPDLSRAELASLLRKAARRQGSERRQKSYWTSFMTRMTGHSANSNANG